MQKKSMVHHLMRFLNFICKFWDFNSNCCYIEMGIRSRFHKINALLKRHTIGFRLGSHLIAKLLVESLIVIILFRQ
jgi:hypothetical protein